MIRKNTIQVLSSLALICAPLAVMAANQTSEAYLVTDDNGDTLTLYALKNSGHPNGGMCYEDGNLEWYTDGSCVGNTQEMTLTAENYLGIGASAPQAQLHLRSEFPAIRLDDAGGENWDLDGNGNFKIRLNNDPVLIIDDNGANAGNIGLNQLHPQAPLHVFREDNTEEMLLLENDSPLVQDRAMMYLSNNGGIRFEFANPALGSAWRFQAATGNEDLFEIARVGTGAIELALDAAGNLEIQGTLTERSDRHAKERIKALSGHYVLERLRAIPVAEWSYIDTPAARHVGPMAQDFHAAFGLGTDETKISPRDMAGVNMAAIQAQQDRIEGLEAQLAELRIVLGHAMARLEAQGESTTPQTASR